MARPSTELWQAALGGGAVGAPPPAISLPPEPAVEVEEVGGADVAAMPTSAAPGMLTEKERQAAIARGRQPHVGSIQLSLGIVFLVTTIAMVAITLWLYFRNRTKARKMVQEQIVAERTAAWVATQLQPFLPPAHAQANRNTKEPLAVVPVETELWRQLQRVDSMGVLVNGQEVAVWVVDTLGFVYADSRNATAAVDPTTHARPHASLADLNVLSADNNTASKPATTVAEVVRRHAAHGAGIVTFHIPTLGSASSKPSLVEVYLRPIPSTRFIVVVGVGATSLTL